jgi:hypothetical protein
MVLIMEVQLLLHWKRGQQGQHSGKEVTWILTVVTTSIWGSWMTFPIGTWAIPSREIVKVARTKHAERFH